MFAQKAALLSEHPDAGREGRVRGTRELVAHRHYGLVYTLWAGHVRILRVLHTARQWPPIVKPAKKGKGASERRVRKPASKAGK